MNRLEKLKHISPREFALLGVQYVAYIKRVVVNDEPGFSIHAADGTEVAMCRDREVAIATIRQNDLEPMSVH